ncbi:cellulase (glycosyl hydrolase family 5) [mine drainage metagenome]|uniref:Cellulase (Glycosyl hydrolase family 5) n=1 Tax=mine drainage metagenome TaxID=410659 RepID=A0A1J5S577_9ZZZZ
MKVIVACWEAASSKDGKVDDADAFWKMWNEVVHKYKSDANVYFEIFNEPHGYTVADLKEFYFKWLETYTDIPRRRIMLDGAGYAHDVNSIGDDNRFDSCLLSFHEYTWFDTVYKTVADWEMPVMSIKYPKRTVVTEFGIPMTTGKDYLGSPVNAVQVAYLQGMTNQMHDRNIGSVYWPGLRAGDSFSLLTLKGNSVFVNNISGLARIQYGWRK